MGVKTATPKPTAGPVTASFDPDQMVAGGLPDNFNGTITEMALMPYNYGGKLDHYILAVRCTIEPDADEGMDTVQAFYGAGRLEDFAPSVDGVNPVDMSGDEPEEMKGHFAVKVGKKDALNNNSNFADWVKKALEAGLDRSKLSNDVRGFEGIHAHFNRVPQAKRSGLVQQAGADGKPKSSDILVITEILGTAAPAAAPKSAPKAAPAAKVAAPKAAPAAPAASGIDDDVLTAAIVEALANAGGTLPKSKLLSVAMGAFEGTDKGKAVQRVNSADYLASRTEFAIDAAGTVALA